MILSNANYSTGITLLYALSLFTTFALAAGYSQREAFHLMLGLHLHTRESTASPLFPVLETSVVDQGNTLLLFLKVTFSNSGLERPNLLLGR